MSDENTPTDPEPETNQKPLKKRVSDAAMGGRVATVVLLGLAVFVTLLVVFAG